MKRALTYLYCGFMALYAPVFTIVLTVNGHKWNTRQLVLMGILSICGIAAALLVLNAKRKRKVLQQPTQRPELSDVFTMQYGDELILTDGKEIIAHLPNNNIQ